MGDHALVSIPSVMEGHAFVSSPSGDIGKEFCQMMHNQVMEDMLTSTGCSTIQHVYNITIPDCQVNAKKLWDMVANMCPKASVAATASGSDNPSPSVIQKALCQVTQSKFMEDAWTSRGCNVVQHLFNITDPDCQTNAKKVWDMVANMCP